MAYGTLVTILLLLVSVPIGLMALITMVGLIANDFVVIAFGQFSDCYGKCICDDTIKS